jgi:mono/diheme cytochrome c family protein
MAAHSLLIWRRSGLAAVLALAAACTPQEPAAEVGRAAFQNNCTSCHGARAQGDGPLSVFVPTGVPNLRHLSLRNGGEFPKTRVIEVVTRISDLQHGIVAMPDFGALLGASPTVYTAPDGTRMETDNTILAIAAYLETIQD